jgi:molybdate transport system ATP-binding protein
VTLALRVALPRRDFTLDLDCEIPERGITGVLGRSGSGKTSLLRCIAGLERGARGRIAFREAVWQDAHQFVPPHRRAVGYVFQESSLFPHLDVGGNLRFALDRVPPAQRRLGLGEAVTLLDLPALLGRRIWQLSGGEQQRVAIARALLSSLRLLLMDEPLSSLDQRSKSEILPHLERLRDEATLPILYVSHALGEIMRLADQLLLLEAGRLRAAGPLQALLARTDLPWDRFGEQGAVFDARIEAHDPHYHLSYVRTRAGPLAVALRSAPVGHPIRVRIDARDVSLALEAPKRTSIINILPATVVALEPADDSAQTMVRLDVGAEPLLARITRRSAADLGLAPGMRVFAQIKSVALMDHRADEP